MMTINDIIVLLTLIIALIAIINEKNRAHLLLKLTKLDVAIFALAFVLINYFVFYKDFEAKGWFIGQLYFDGFGLHQPKHYAYVITLISLIYLFYKIYSSFYAHSKIQRVLTFYNRQVETHEISFLVELIEHYHKNDIIRLLQNAPDADENAEPELEIEIDKDWLDKIKERWHWFVASVFPLSRTNKGDYASQVLNNVISTPGFICYAANLRPYFFSDLYRHFAKSKRQHFPDELINEFFLELLREKNYWLRKELKESENHDYGQPERFHEDNRILSGLLQDLSVAAESQVWQSFGDTAVDEIQAEAEKGQQSLLYREYISDTQLWEFKTQYTVQFFKILIIEAINKKYEGEHFWLFYYDRIIEAILGLWRKNPPEGDVKQTVAYQFISNIWDYYFRWLEQSNDKEDDGYFHDILSSIGNVLQKVTDSAQVPQDLKVRMIDSLFILYNRLEGKGQTLNLQKKMEEILIRPNLLINGQSPYYGYVAMAWNDFDQIPFRIQNFMDLPQLGRLKRHVIGPLGLDIHFH